MSSPAAADMSIQAGLGAEVIPLSRLHGAAVVCLVGIGKPEVRSCCCCCCCRRPLHHLGMPWYGSSAWAVQRLHRCGCCRQLHGRAVDTMGGAL